MPIIPDSITIWQYLNINTYIFFLGNIFSWVTYCSCAKSRLHLLRVCEDRAWAGTLALISGRRGWTDYVSDGGDTNVRSDRQSSAWVGCMGVGPAHVESTLCWNRGCSWWRKWEIFCQLLIKIIKLNFIRNWSRSLKF